LRYILLAALALVACGGRHTADAPSLSDDELVAFTRWQRDYAELLGRHLAELNAIASPDPSKPVDEAVAEAQRAATEAAARHRPAMQAVLDRQPLTGVKAELAAEATGGLFHVEQTQAGVRIVIARDEERIGAARRRFGPKAVDDVLARESLILAELRRP
jgi:hypothetical protein